MTDLSKIRTIDELDYQTQRLQRRADIQRQRLNGHADYVIRQYNYVTGAINAVVQPLRSAFNEYRTVFRVIARIARALFGNKK